jgi:flavin-dependent dehydrogenase
VVVGASVAGCSAARFFGLAGARVALVERRPDPDAYKVVCTHQILSCAVPAIERLGLAEPLAQKGAMRSGVEAWSPFGGWMRLPSDAPLGYGVTRQTLDPLLRDLAANTPGVELLTGRTAVGLLGDDGRPAGIEVETTGRGRERINARLVVGADGRDSRVARMAGVPGRVRAHGRFFYFAYWRGVRPRSDAARVWFLDPEGAADFPNEDDLNVVTVAPTHARLDEFRADPEREYMRMVASLPDGPDLENAERVSKLIGKLDTPNVLRPAARPGVAFVGDAAVASDPSFGVGCGFAFQTAEWLVDHTSRALLGDGDGDLDRALGRYRRTVLRRLGLEHFLMSDMSTGRKLRLNERLVFRAAAKDPATARAMEPITSRRQSSVRLLSPAFTARVLLSA